MARCCQSKMRGSRAGIVVLCLVHLLGRLEGWKHGPAFGSVRAEVVELAVETDGGGFPEFCITGYDGTSLDAPCTVPLALKKRLFISCPRDGATYWPDGWNTPAGAGCAEPPSVDCQGRLRPCQSPVSWTEHNIVWRDLGPSGDVRSFTLQVPDSRVEVHLGRILELYGACNDAAGSSPLYWKARIIPETAPVYQIVPYHFDAQRQQNHEIIVNLHRGDALAVRAEGIVDPITALKKDGNFCLKDVEGPLHRCEDEAEWGSLGVMVKQDSADSATLRTAPTNVDRQVVEAHFKIITASSEHRFLVKVYPTIPDHFLHAYAYEEGFFAECHPDDGPLSHKPCDGGVVPEDGFAYVNCTEVGDFDPPDINTPGGSFCTEPYTDFSTPCSLTRRWEEIFVKPELRSEKQLFSVYYSEPNLQEPATVYGRCGRAAGAVLFFKYQFGNVAEANESSSVRGEVRVKWRGEKGRRPIANLILKSWTGGGSGKVVLKGSVVSDGREVVRGKVASEGAEGGDSSEWRLT